MHKLAASDKSKTCENHKNVISLSSTLTFVYYEIVHIVQNIYLKNLCINCIFTLITVDKQH